MHLREENMTEEEANMKLYYFCEICGKSYANKSALKTHRMHVHENYSEDVPCDVCGKSFRTRELLKQHQEREHNEFPKYACDTCGQRFGNNYHLKRHEVIHTDEEFPCTMCSRRFKRKDGLDTHMAHIHGGSNIDIQDSVERTAVTQNYDSVLESDHTEVVNLADNKNLTELINLGSVADADFYSNVDKDETTSHVIDPFLPTVTTVATLHSQHEEPITDQHSYYTFESKGRVHEHNIMSQLENLSQYKSSTMVSSKSHLQFDLQVNPILCIKISTLGREISFQLH